jgi:hypothetical protein
VTFPTSPNYGDTWTNYGNAYVFDGTVWVITQSAATGLLPTAPQLAPADRNGLVEWNSDTDVFNPMNNPATPTAGQTYERPPIADGSILKWDQTNNRIVAAVPNVDYQA